MTAIDRERVLTVTALSKYIAAKFDRDPYLQEVTIVGEISNFRPRPNSHQYFNLKDDQSQINAVLFKGVASKIPFQLEEGMKVYATGRIQTYRQRGTYQLVITQLAPDGVGALYLALEQLKEKLKKAGWFDQPKKPLPKFPKKIAVITSPTGSVIHDIMTTIKRRYPIVSLVVYPTRVQGDEAVPEIVQAFQQIKANHTEIDTVILARGGGSIEDLWCFNSELIAREILECPVPVISSIGHETDTTIADLVADVRAATPTAAAELAVPVLNDILLYLKQTQERLNLQMIKQLREERRLIDRLNQSFIFKQPARLYQPFIQDLDRLTERLHQGMRQEIQSVTYNYQSMHQQLMTYNLLPRIAYHQQEQSHFQGRLNQAMLQMMKTWTNKRQQLDQLLVANSPTTILSKGYTVTEKDDQLVESVEDLSVGDQLAIHYRDGQSLVEVKEISHQTKSEEDKDE